jgi:repressor LexA
MSNSFGHTFYDLRMKAGYSKLSQLSKASGISIPVLSRIQRGESNPRPDTLRKLTPYLGVSYEELMRLAGHLPSDEEEIDWGDIDPVDAEQPISVLVFKNFDAYKRWGDYVGSEFIPHTYRGHNHVYIVAEDNSMLASGIRKGDLVLIRLDEVLDNGDIAAIAVDSKLIFRRYIRSQGVIHLLSDERGVIVECYSIEEVQVFGKVIRVVSNFE